MCASVYSETLDQAKLIYSVTEKKIDQHLPRAGSGVGIDWDWGWGKALGNRNALNLGFGGGYTGVCVCQKWIKLYPFFSLYSCNGCILLNINYISIKLIF